MTMTSSYLGQEMVIKYADGRLTTTMNGRSTALPPGEMSDAMEQFGKPF